MWPDSKPESKSLNFCNFVLQQSEGKCSNPRKTNTRVLVRGAWRTRQAESRDCMEKIKVAGGCASVVPALRRVRQKDCWEFETTLNYMRS